MYVRSSPALLIGCEVAKCCTEGGPAGDVGFCPVPHLHLQLYPSRDAKACTLLPSICPHKLSCFGVGNVPEVRHSRGVGIVLSSCREIVCIYSYSQLTNCTERCCSLHVVHLLAPPVSAMERRPTACFNCSPIVCCQFRLHPAWGEAHPGASIAPGIYFTDSLHSLLKACFIVACRTGQ